MPPLLLHFLKNKASPVFCLGTHIWQKSHYFPFWEQKPTEQFFSAKRAAVLQIHSSSFNLNQLLKQTQKGRCKFNPSHPATELPGAPILLSRRLVHQHWCKKAARALRTSFLTDLLTDLLGSYQPVNEENIPVTNIRALGIQRGREETTQKGSGGKGGGRRSLRLFAS